MEQKLTECSALVLLFMPLFVALVSLIIEFNALDFVYVVLAGTIFLKYFIKTRKLKK